MAPRLGDQSQRQPVSDARSRPIANCLDINRGDRFDYLVSMSGPSRGLQAWAAEHEPADSPKRREHYVLGDVNVSLIKTMRGRTIVVEHCTNLPRPYSRIHMVQGTKGLFQGYPNRVYVEGRGKDKEWQQATEVQAEFEHPLWKDLAERASGAGHGGMDYIEDYRLDQMPARGTPDGHERLRRRGAERRRRIEYALERAQERAARRTGLHSRQVEDQPSARHRPHVRSPQPTARVR